MKNARIFIITYDPYRIINKETGELEREGLTVFYYMYKTPEEGGGSRFIQKVSIPKSAKSILDKCICKEVTADFNYQFVDKISNNAKLRLVSINGTKIQ